MSVWKTIFVYKVDVDPIAYNIFIMSVALQEDLCLSTLMYMLIDSWI